MALPLPIWAAAGLGGVDLGEAAETLRYFCEQEPLRACSTSGRALQELICERSGGTASPQGQEELSCRAQEDWVHEGAAGVRRGLQECLLINGKWVKRHHFCIVFLTEFFSGVL